MIKKLVAHGNSAALIIDKPGKNLIVSPVSGPTREEKFRQSLKRVFKRHAASLKRLS